MYEAQAAGGGWRVVWREFPGGSPYLVTVFTGDNVRDAQAAAKDYAVWCNRQAAIDAEVRKFAEAHGADPDKAFIRRLK